MTTPTSTIVTALFKDAIGVRGAYRVALDRGFKEDDIDLVMSETTQRQQFQPIQVGVKLADKAAESTEKSQPDATELGGPAGGTAATIAPAVAAVGTVMLLPGLALAGPIAIALAAAGAVGVAGGLAGALAHWGLPKTRVEEYEKQIREGAILMGVRARSDADRQHLEREWTAAGGVLTST